MKELITIPKCKFDNTKLIIEPGLEYKEWEKIGIFLRHVEGSVQFWIGDWINYGEKSYGKTYEKALEATGLEYGTLRNYKNVSGRVELSLRNDNLEFHHHQVVAPLEPEQQKKWLDKAEKDGLSVRELRGAIAKDRQKSVAPIPVGEFNVIYADPPWKYEFSETDSRMIENKYPTMDVQDIESMSIPSSENSVLFLWATAPKLQEALLVMRGWGFDYVTHAIWDKKVIGMGYWFRGQHELLLVGTKGAPGTPDPENRFSSVIESKREGHSEKPKIVYEMIEKMFPRGKYLEVFHRGGNRSRWIGWGLESE